MTTNPTVYVEQDCTIEHEGRTFSSGGAYVTPNYAIGYLSDKPGERPAITDWHGQFLGFATVKARWPIRSWMGSHMYQVEATINGVRYTGRTLGNGMIWRGKVAR